MNIRYTDCPGCHARFQTSLSLLDGQLVGPFVTLRSAAGEQGQRALMVVCPHCGLLSLYNAAWVQHEAEAEKLLSGRTTPVGED